MLCSGRHTQSPQTGTLCMKQYSCVALWHLHTTMVQILVRNSPTSVSSTKTQVFFLFDIPLCCQTIEAYYMTQDLEFVPKISHIIFHRGSLTYAENQIYQGNFRTVFGIRLKYFFNRCATCYAMGTIACMQPKMTKENPQFSES